MLKATANSIAEPLSMLFNHSLSTGRFPELWKVANVIPISKSGDKGKACNYRPVSLLSIVSKLFEKIIYSIIWNHLYEHSLISDCQWGFLRGRSTTNTLLTATNDWCSLLDKPMSTNHTVFWGSGDSH